MSRVKRNPCTTSFGANTTFWQHKARDYVTQLRNMYHSLSNACKGWGLFYSGRLRGIAQQRYSSYFSLSLKQ